MSANLAAVPSQSPAPPVMVVQNDAQVEPVTPLKVNKLEIAKLVVVALVPVALLKVKFCKVVEPTTRRSPDELMVEVAVPPILNWLAVSWPEKSEVEVAAVVVERVMLLKMWAPVQVGEKDWSMEKALPE